MSKVPKLFFATGGVFVLIGMLWGIQMAISGDHLLAPAHAHLNLIGFVLMSIFGTYYALTPSAADSRLAMIHYGLHTVAVVVMVPGITMAILEKGEAMVATGSLLALASMILYVVTVLRHGVGKSA